LRSFLKKNLYLPIEVYMFKNFRALSAFVGFLALLFVFAAFLATCSSDSPEEKPSSPSRPPIPSSGSVADPSVDIDVTRFEVYLTGSKQENLNVEFIANITIKDDSFDNKFDSVLIYLAYEGGQDKLLNVDKKRPEDSEGRGFSWYSRDTYDGKIDVSGSEYCGKKLIVRYWAYAKNEAGVPKGYEEKDVTRELARCTEPSSTSTVPSSNSVVSKTLSPVSFGGAQTIRINQNVGVNLSTGTEVSAGSATANIYYSPNPSNKIMAGPGIKLMQNFRHPEQGCTEFWSIAGAATGTTNPTNTSDFFEPCGSEETSIDPYMPNIYYLVKTNSETSWNSGWYIIVSDTRPAEAAGTTGIEIKAWKVN
jgi:hypothetical protein